MSWLEKAHAVTNNSWNSIFDFTGGDTPDTSRGWQDIATQVLNWMLALAGLLAVAYLIYSGILYITAAGNPDQAKKGQQGVINAVIGIVIIAATWAIIGLAFNLSNEITT